MTYQAFKDAYREAIEFTDASAEGEDECFGLPWSTDLEDRIEVDCRAFYDAYSHLWSDLSDYGSQWGADAMAGHDFWLTRNGHGAGFWDRAGLPPEIGLQLTNAATAFGPCEIYAGDDGEAYCLAGAPPVGFHAPTTPNNPTSEAGA